MKNRLRNGRVQTQGFDAVQRIQPAGLPGSTYVRPAEVDSGASNLRAVAEALGSLSSNLSNFAQSQKAKEAAAVREQAALESQARADQKEALRDSREQAKDARDAARFQDEQDKATADDLPYESMGLPELQKLIEDNDRPGGNSFASKKASVVFGKRYGKEFLDTTLRQAYENYDPSSGKTVSQHLLEETNKYLDENFPMEDRRNWYVRGGFSSIIDPAISSFEKQEADFTKTKGKVMVEEGAAVEASQIVQDGMTKGLPKQAVAAQFLSQWGSLRAEAQGSRANPEFYGADVHTQFKAQVEALAAAGEYELVNEIVTQAAPGLAAPLEKGPDGSWALKQKATAKENLFKKQRDQNWSMMSDYEVLADQGQLGDPLVQAGVQSGAIKPEEAERLRTKNRLQRMSIDNAARDKMVKTEAEAAHNAAVDTEVNRTLAAMMTTGGGGLLLEDKTVPSKDGLGTAALSSTQLKDRVVAAWQEQHTSEVERVRMERGDEAAAQYDVDKSIEFFRKNGDIENPRWKSLFAGAGAAVSLQALANAGKDGNIPANLKQAASVYARLSDVAPGLAWDYVKDEKTRVILESVRIAQDRAAAYTGGGSFTEAQAWATAMNIAQRVNENPNAALPRVDWSRKNEKALRADITRFGQSTLGWVFGGDGATVSEDVVNDVKKLANFYLAAGDTEEEAVARAIEAASTDYIQVNGSHLVNAKGISDKEGFVQFIEETIPMKLSADPDSPNDPDADASDYSLRRLPDGSWLVMNGPTPAVDKNGPLRINADDYKRWKELEMNKQMTEAWERNNGKAEWYEILWNGLVNAEDRGLFWTKLEKFRAMKERERLWEEQRLSREGGPNSSSSSLILDKVSDERRRVASEYQVPLEDSTDADLMRLRPSDVHMPTLIRSVIRAESNGIPHAESEVGALGLMQLMPDGGAVDAARALGDARYLNATPEQRRSMLLNPEYNERLGTQYLNMMLDKYGDVERALAAYNWGQGNVDKWIDGGARFSELPKETRDYISKIMPYVQSSALPEMEDGTTFNGPSGQTKLRYANQNAIRSRRVTPELETKLDRSVAAVFGPGYTVEIFSGGQAKKGTSRRSVVGYSRTGSTRHDDHGNGGRAADVYIYGPDGKKVRDRAKLTRLKNYWLSRGMGSVGTFMSDFGMHLDELTQDELGPGQGLTWDYNR